MDILLALAFALGAGLLSSKLMKFLKLPNVTGYLLAGLLIGPYCIGLIKEHAAESLSIVTSVALGFIAFSIGSEFKLKNLKAMGGKIVVITLCQALLALILVDAVLFFLGAPMPVVLTLGAIATATAPAATLMVVRQYKAKGPLVNTLLPVVALDDAVGLMAFSVSLAVASVMASGSRLTIATALLEPLREIGLSILIGAGLGLLFVLLAKLFRSKESRLVAMIALVFVGIFLSELLELSALILCMMIGAVFANLTKDCDEVFEEGEKWTAPVYVLFFVLSGAHLDLRMVPAIGLIGVAYILVRSIGKYAGAFAGCKIVRAEKSVTKYLGLTLLPQAGVAIGMAQLAVKALPQYGTTINTVVLCATLVYELFGPVITKIALFKANEADPSMLPQKRLRKIPQGLTMQDPLPAVAGCETDAHMNFLVRAETGVDTMFLGVPEENQEPLYIPHGVFESESATPQTQQTPEHLSPVHH